VAAVDPSRLVRDRLHRQRSRIAIDLGSRVLHRPLDRLWIAAAGKAAVGMAAGLLEVIPEARGVAIAPSAVSGLGRGMRVLKGSHPVPDEDTFSATRALLAALARRPLEATVLVLLSGGASSLMAAPAPGLRRADKVELGRWLLRSGLAIREMNAVRKHASAVKGGGLLARAFPREVVSLVLSDVPGDDLETIASGPTVADPTTFAEALAAVRGARGGGPLSAAALRHLELGAAGRRPETLKPGDGRLARAHARVIGSNGTALAGAGRAARSLGYEVRRGPALAGEAAACAVGFAGALPPSPRRPTCILAGGETTVTISRGRGRGGRCQELALAAAGHLPAGWALLAAGTDGIDGQTPAAGAFADASARQLGRAAIAAALRKHDSHGILASKGHLFVTGPTGTNAMDLVVALHPGR
jgi:glycerate 2-kinase